MWRKGRPRDGGGEGVARRLRLPSRATARTALGVKRPAGSEVVPAQLPPRPCRAEGRITQGWGNDPCAGLLRVKLFIDFAHFGPGCGEVRVVRGEQQVARAMRG